MLLRGCVLSSSDLSQGFIRYFEEEHTQRTVLGSKVEHLKPSSLFMVQIKILSLALIMVKVIEGFHLIFQTLLLVKNWFKTNLVVYPYEREEILFKVLDFVSEEREVVLDSEVYTDLKVIGTTKVIIDCNGI